MAFYNDFPIYGTIKEMVLDGAKRGGDKREFLFEDENGELQERSFFDTHEDEMRLGAYLWEQGLRPPLKIAILSENS